MDQLLLFEYLHADRVEFECAGDNIRSEAGLMLQSLLADAVALDGIQVSVVLCDDAADTLGPLPDNVELYRCRSRDSVLEVLVEAAVQADFVLPVAPECDSLLITVAQALRPLNCRVLLPPLATVEQCSDKLLTWNTFASDAIPMLPCDTVVTKAANSRYRDESLIFKPRFGVGCGGIQRGNLPLESDPADYIQQPWIDGESVSVGVLSGCNGFCSLPVARQNVIWQNDQPIYRGGTIPANLGNGIAEQITAIAEQVMQQIGSFSGYLGLDFLVVETDNAVFLNEVNSRLSTSYIGYRQLLETNPLEVLLGRKSDVIRNEDSEPISFDVRTAFHAD